MFSWIPMRIVQNLHRKNFLKLSKTKNKKKTFLYLFKEIQQLDPNYALGLQMDTYNATMFFHAIREYKEPLYEWDTEIIHRS